MIVFLVSDRYRVITWPAVSVAATVGLAWLLERRDAWRPAPLAGLAALALIPWAPVHPRADYQPAWCLHQSANFAYTDGDHRRAADLYRAAIQYDPGDLSAMSWLGQALLKLGRPHEAVEVVEGLVAAFPDSHPSLVLLSNAHRRAGDLDAAADAMGRAYRIPGPRSRTGARYIELLVRAGRRDEARAVAAADPALARQEKVRALLAAPDEPGQRQDQ